MTAEITRAEEGGFVALNPETGTTTQGETAEEAVANLKEATALYLGEFPLALAKHPEITTFCIPIMPTLPLAVTADTSRPLQNSELEQ